MSRDKRNPEEPYIIAIGSGAGGSGRTTVAIELARVFSRRGVPTVLVDCALTLPIVAEVMGRSDRRKKQSAGLFSPGAHLSDFVQREGPNSPAILTFADAVSDPQKPLNTSPAKLLERLRRLEDQVVILDLPAGPQPFWSDLFVLSDIPLVISGPEGWSVVSLVPFLTMMVERADELEPAARVKSYLVLNGCRDAAERDLGEVLCHAIWRRLGHYPRYLGPLDFDDRRWFHLRHGDACSPLSSSFGLGVQSEDLVKRLLALEEFNRRRPRRLSLEAQRESPSAVWFGLSETATPADLRSQYRRLWEGYRRESAISQVLFSGEERAAIISELEQTYRALQMCQEEGRPRSEAVGTSEIVAEREPLPHSQSSETAAPPAVTEAADVSHCGSYLQQTRKNRQMSLRELSLRTKIGLHYLEAIEALDAKQLPLPVYLRGYLREIARVLDLPVHSLLDRYLTELARRQQEDTASRM